MNSVIHDNNDLKEEKTRILGVNQILEKKIQVEKSELMSLQNDVNVLVQDGRGGSEYGSTKLQRKLG